MGYRRLRGVPSLKALVARRRKGAKYADYASQRPGKPIPQPAALVGKKLKGL